MFVYLKTPEAEGETLDAEEKALKKKYSGRRMGALVAVEMAAVAAVVFALLFIFVIGIAAVSGVSMEPTYTEGQRVLFLKVVHSFSRGDVVAVRMLTGETYIKRVAAVPGDTVEIRDGVFCINGEAENEVHAHGATEPEGVEVVYPLTLGEDEYFLMGDNREESIDSRSFGTVVPDQIMGLVPDL